MDFFLVKKLISAEYYRFYLRLGIYLYFNMVYSIYLPLSMSVSMLIKE